MILAKEFTIMIHRLLYLGLGLLMMPGLSAQTVPPDVFYHPGSSQKIEQLVGDYDRHRQTPTRNLTDTRYQLWGTDLGIPFVHDGKTFVLFGDIPGSDRDPLAHTNDQTPENGLALSFMTHADGTYKPINVPGITQGALEVPTEGISVDGKMYIYHTTDNMGRSALARSTDNGQSFTLVEGNISTGHFINLSVVKVDGDDMPWLPDPSGNTLVIFGSGDYRASTVRLAVQAAAEIEDKQSMRYFTGLDANQNPRWSANEQNAIPLFSEDCIGEFSVSYNPFIKKWLLLYNCDDPRGINFRTADQPWGPWSEAQVLFDPWTDNGYCQFMHVDWNYDNCDQVHDPGRANEWGGEYGPYQFEEFAIGNDSSTTIYYTMSTWNPYTVVLMKSVLVKPLVTTVEHIGQQDFSIRVFPNPADQQLTLVFPYNHDRKNITVFDALGQVVEQFSSTSEQLTLDINRWKSGVYLIHAVHASGRSTISKVLKK